MASHLLDEVKKVCTHVAILKKGTLITTGNVNKILANEDFVEIGSEDNEKLMLIVKSLKNYTGLKEADGFLQLSFPIGAANLTEINKHCFNNGITLNHLYLKKKSLEAKFFELTNN